MTTFADARKANWIKPVYLLQIQTLNSGPILYFANSNIKVGAQHYADYMISMTSIQQSTSRIDGKGINSNIRLRFKNRPFSTYDKLIELRDDNPMTGAEITIKEIYFDRHGAQTTVDTVAVGVLDEAVNITSEHFDHNISNLDFVTDLKNYGGL